MSRRRLAGALALLGLAAAGCGGGAAGDEKAGPGVRVPVGLAVVVRDSLVETLALPGRLEARPGGAALLAAPAAGVVRAMRAQLGDGVARGAVVAELDVPELAADAAQKAAAAAQAEREAARQRRLLADGVTSARQAEETAAAAEQAGVAAASARHLLARTTVTTPISGRVQEVLVQRGERVDAGQPIARVVRADTLDLMVSVPAADLSRLRPGLMVTVLQEGDSTPLPARVAALAPAVDSLTNAGVMVIRVPNPGVRFRPGAGAVARVDLGVRAAVLVVPDSAIVLAGDSSVVFVVGNDSIAHQRSVLRGVRAGGRTEVRGQLSPGERVVTTGAFGLEDGMRVAPDRAPAP